MNSFSNSLAQLEHWPQLVATFNVSLKSSSEEAPHFAACWISRSVTAWQIQIYIVLLQDEFI